MPLSLDPVTTVAQEFAAQVDAENAQAKLPAAADQIAQDWASSGSIGQQRDTGGTGNSNLDRLASISAAPQPAPAARVDYGNSNLARLAAMPVGTSEPSLPDETITAAPTIHQLATQTIPAPSFLGGSVANLPGYAQDYGQTPHTLGGMAFGAGLPMPEQPTLISALQSLPGLSDEQKQGLVQASPYIRDQLSKGQKFGDVLTDILGTPNMDTLQAAAALANEPFRIGTEALKAIPTGGGTSLGQRIENAPAPVRLPAEFALGAAPYVGALAAAGATGGTSLAGLGGLVGTGVNAGVALQLGATADSYQRGEITEKQAAVQLAPLIGGYAADPILRVIAKGAAAAGVSAGEWLKTPAGQQALRFAASERGSLGTGPEGAPAEPSLAETGTAAPVPGQVGAPPPSEPLPEPPNIAEAQKNLAEVAKTGDVDAMAAAQAQLDAARQARSEAANIPQIEAQTKLPTVEERAALPRNTAQAFFNPETTSEVTATAIKSDIDNYQRIQNLIQKVPGLRSVGTYIESVGAAKAQKALGNDIPLAMVKRDITIGRQSSAARAGLLGWAGNVREVLGLDPNGIAHGVEVREGADIPKKIAQRLDDIIEHPEDYNLTPAQKAALVPVEHTLNASTQHALNAGVDVHEIGGPYFPRTITKGPKGEAGAGRGGGLTSKPGFAKTRVFPDTRSAVAAGYQVASPFEALGDRLISGVRATANKEAYKEILALGEKPSSRIPQTTTKALLDAREAYKAARASGDQRAIDVATNELDAAKRELRKGGLKAATPTIGETKAYGRIFPKPVMDELAKYGDVSGPGIVDEFFAIQRANETTGDHSALLVQGGNLLYRNPVAWLKAAAYSTASFAREPWGWVSRNMPAIEAAVKDGAAQPPAEFLLQSGGRLSQRLHSGDFGPDLTRPVTRAATSPIRAAQRMFEWMVFIGQVEWHKAAVDMGMSAAERQEIGAVVRKGMGSSSQPGITNAMRTFDRRLWYAGGFMRSTLGLMADASRGGARGAEARKTLGMVIGGATALTIGLQYAVNRTMPNLTDPNNKNKRWGYVEFPGGGVNVYGPLLPYIRLIGKAGQDLQRGDVGAAASEGQSLLTGKVALPIRTALDLRSGTTFVGDKIAPGWKGTLTYLAQQAEPLGIRQATTGSIEGIKRFPEQTLETLGGRTTPNSPYQLANRALIAHGVAAGMGGTPKEKADVRAQFPDVAKALDAYDQSTIDKGTTGGQIKEARGLAGEAQQAADDALQSGSISVRQWKDARKSVNDTLSGNIWQITKGQPYASGDKVLDDYYAVFQKFQKPGGAIIDKQGLQDALDQYTASLSLEDQQHLDQNTGLSKTTPKVQEYRSAVKQLGDAGFFDQEKLGYNSPYWQKLFAAAKTPLAKNGLMPDRFASLGAMKAAYVQAYQNANPKIDPQSAAADAAREFERIAAVKQFRTQLNQHLQNFYKSNPALLRLATQWGFNTLSKAEEKILAGAGAPK